MQSDEWDDVAVGVGQGSRESCATRPGATKMASFLMIVYGSLRNATVYPERWIFGVTSMRAGVSMHVHAYDDFNVMVCVYSRVGNQDS